MSELIAAKASTVKFWAIGGTGINQLRAYRQDQPKNQPQLADESFAYIDTSFSNLEGASKDDLYILNKGLGLGKDQREGEKIFKAETPAILAKFTPAVVNVMFFSLSGGTGSTGGRALFRSLLEAGHTCIAVVIGDYGSARSTGNTLASIMNFEKDLAKIQTPYAVTYHQNDPRKSLVENNKTSLFIARMLSMFGSGKNAHLDVSDVKNFFDYRKSTKIKPALALLEVHCTEDELNKAVDGHQIISYAALLKSTEDLVPQIDSEYDTHGYLPEEGRAFDNSFYFTLSATRMANILNDLRERLKQFQLKAAVQTQVETLHIPLAEGADDEETVYL